MALNPAIGEAEPSPLTLHPFSLCLPPVLLSPLPMVTFALSSLGPEKWSWMTTEGQIHPEMFQKRYSPCTEESGLSLLVPESVGASFPFRVLRRWAGWAPGQGITLLVLRRTLVLRRPPELGLLHRDTKWALQEWNRMSNGPPPGLVQCLACGGSRRHESGGPSLGAVH